MPKLNPYNPGTIHRNVGRCQTRSLLNHTTPTQRDDGQKTHTCSSRGHHPFNPGSFPKLQFARACQLGMCLTLCKYRPSFGSLPLLSLLSFSFSPRHDLFSFSSLSSHSEAFVLTIGSLLLFHATAVYCRKKLDSADGE